MNNGFCLKNLGNIPELDLKEREKTIGAFQPQRGHRNLPFLNIPRDPITLSDDEQGVSNHLRNARYLGSVTILRRWARIPRAFKKHLKLMFDVEKMILHKETQLPGMQRCTRPVPLKPLKGEGF